jgi:hypothetical protein
VTSTVLSHQPASQVVRLVLEVLPASKQGKEMRPVLLIF